MNYIDLLISIESFTGPLLGPQTSRNGILSLSVERMMHFTESLTCHDVSNCECQGCQSLTCQTSAAHSTTPPLFSNIIFTIFIHISKSKNICSKVHKYFQLFVIIFVWVSLASNPIFRHFSSAKCRSTIGIGTGSIIFHNSRYDV